MRVALFGQAYGAKVTQLTHREPTETELGVRDALIGLRQNLLRSGHVQEAQARVPEWAPRAFCERRAGRCVPLHSFLVVGAGDRRRFLPVRARSRLRLPSLCIRARDGAIEIARGPLSLADARATIARFDVHSDARDLSDHLALPQGHALRRHMLFVARDDCSSRRRSQRVTVRACLPVNAIPRSAGRSGSHRGPRMSVRTHPNTD